MREDYIKDILAQVKDGRMSEEAAFEQLKVLPYKDM